MTSFSILTDEEVTVKMDSYPIHVRPKMEALRKMILSKAESIETISSIHETLKWGEPSYIVHKGSTIRMDWKSKTPDQYALYFSCSTKLVATFRALYGSQLTFQKNRAIIFSLDQKIPKEIINDCIEMALRYHSLKALPLLGN